MDHSLESYLARQSTKTLERLLQQYEGSEAAMDAYAALLIQNILNKRTAAG